MINAPPARCYAVGDLVMLHLPRGLVENLNPNAFRVTRVLEHDRYEVGKIAGMQRSKIPYHGKAGLDNMKPWIHFINDEN